MSIIKLFFDGCSKGNPGPSGAGFWIKSETTSFGGYKYLGNQTNNVAEYSGLILGLKSLVFSDQSIKVYGDSKLVIEQMKRKWKVNAVNLLPLWKEAQEIIKDYKNIEFIHIDRSLNSTADKMANLAVSTKSSNTNVLNY